MIGETICHPSKSRPDGTSEFLHRRGPSINRRFPKVRRGSRDFEITLVPRLLVPGTVLVSSSPTWPPAGDIRAHFCTIKRDA